jgi:hypothetical protein
MTNALRPLEGAATGAAAGPVIDAAVAWLASIETVTILQAKAESGGPDPQPQETPPTALGPLLGAGPVLAALAGAGVCGIPDCLVVLVIRLIQGAQDHGLAGGSVNSISRQAIKPPMVNELYLVG